jgi:hypothetical protein
MAARLAYFAQPFFAEAGQFRAGPLYPFNCASDAEEGGELLSRMAAGAVAYQQIIDPEAELFDEPEMLAVFGRVPASAREPQGEAA